MNSKNSELQASISISDQQMQLVSVNKDELKPSHNLTCANLGAESCSCNRLKRVNKEVETALDLLKSLLKKQHETSIEVNKDHPSIVDRMPLEITNLIFSFYVAPESCKPDEIAKAASPLRLGAVCQSWRRIAWSTPRLWTFFTMRLSSDTSAMQVKIAAEILDRSLHYPLSITLYEVGELGELLEYKNVHNLIDIVNGHSTRWGSLDLRLPYHLLRRVSNSAGSSDLRSLAVYNNDWEHQMPDGVELQIYDVAPWSVNFHNMCWSVADYLRWEEVINFEGGHHSAKDALELLKCAPNLSKCTFLVITDAPQASILASIDRSVHKKLQSLTVSFHRQLGGQIIFFDNATLPALRSLSIETFAGCELEVQSLTSFLTRCSCPLQELTLSEAVVTGEDLVLIAKSVPSLVQLKIFPHENSQLLLDPFCLALGELSTSGKPLLPLLKDFVLFGMGLTIPWELLLKGIFFPFEAGKTLDNPRRPIKTFSLYTKLGDDDPLPVIDQSVVETMRGFMHELEEDLDLDACAERHDVEFDLLIMLKNLQEKDV